MQLGVFLNLEGQVLFWTDRKKLYKLNLIDAQNETFKLLPTVSILKT